MSAAYSEAFIEQALVKVVSRGARSIRSVSEDLNVSFHTLKYWMTRKTKKDRRPRLATSAKRPQDWSPQEQLVALHEKHGLSGEALQAWCRERGVSLISWKAGEPLFV